MKRSIHNHPITRPVFRMVIELSEKLKIDPEMAANAVCYVAAIVARASGMPRHVFVRQAGRHWDDYDGPVMPFGQQQENAQRDIS